MIADNNVVVQCIMPEIFQRGFCKYCGGHGLTPYHHFGTQYIPENEERKITNQPSWHILYRR